MGHAFRGRRGREGVIGSASNGASSSIWSTRVRKTLTTCESIGRPGSRSPIAMRISTIRRKKRKAVEERTTTNRKLSEQQQARSEQWAAGTRRACIWNLETVSILDGREIVWCVVNILERF